MSKTIACRDFMPADTTPMLAVSRRYESMPQLLERVNRWIAEASVDVMHVETLLLPGTPAKAKDEATYVELDLGPVSIAQWFQALRVWYWVEG